MHGPNPNYKFYEIADEADKVALLAGEVAALFHEATKDGINVYRQTIIRRNCNMIEQRIRNLREEVEPVVKS